MRTAYYLCWVDDIEGFVTSYEMKIEMLQKDFNVEFVIDEHYHTRDFDTIAKAIDDDLIFLIDYNLKGNDGKGIDGDELIKQIREYNQKCIIVFYSSKATQEELRELIAGISNVICTTRESLADILIEIANGELKNRKMN